MPWKACNKMDERVRFIARLLESEKMAPLCLRRPKQAGTGIHLLACPFFAKHRLADALKGAAQCKVAFRYPGQRSPGTIYVPRVGLYG